jgi:hypothetical protein
LFVVKLNATAWQHLCHVTHIGLMHRCSTTQLAFIFGGLLGQDVTFEGVTALNGATWTNAEPFLGRALGLHFGHLNAPFHCAREALGTDPRLVGPEPLLSERISPFTFQNDGKPPFWTKRLPSLQTACR